MGGFLDTVYKLVWGVPALLLILGVGIYLAFRTRWVQLRLFPAACKDLWRRLTGRDRRTGGVSSFQALCTALAATVGTGNLAGVAGALAIGGPGAIFWMWVCGLLGMGLKLAEATLAVRYRVVEDGQVLGGPMYVISQGLGPAWRPLAAVYSFFGVIAAFGVGCATQVDALLTSVRDLLGHYGHPLSPNGELVLGLVLAVTVLILLSGGARRIGRAAERLVPVAAAGYLVLGGLVLIVRAGQIPEALLSIVQGAFAPQAVTGGLVGSALTTLRIGVSRGVFTNEAGMGTAGMAHGSAQVDHPVEQGLMGIMEVFLDTIVICTLTALVILCSGIPVPYGGEAGMELTAAAFSQVLGGSARIFLTAALCLFAFATMLGWGMYGARCAQYLLGRQVWRWIPWLQALTVVLGTILSSGMVWHLAEIVNGLMALPGLIALAATAPELCRLIKDYERKTGRSAGGGTICRSLSTPTAVSHRPCGNSTPTRCRPKRRANGSFT